MSIISRSVRDFSRVSTGSPMSRETSQAQAHWDSWSLQKDLNIRHGFPASEHVPGLGSLIWSQLISSSSFCSSKATELCTAASTAVALLALMVGRWEVRTGKKPDVSTASALWEVVNFHLTSCLGFSCKIIQSNCQCDPIHETTCH